MIKLQLLTLQLVCNKNVIYGGKFMNKSKFCSFYVSDIHLITMLLPYINEKMKEKKEFITIFETDISESAEKVIKSVSLKRKEEIDFLNIGWKKRNKIRNLKLNDKYIIVMGSDDFIKRMNTELEGKELAPLGKWCRMFAKGSIL